MPDNLVISCRLVGTRSVVSSTTTRSRPTLRRRSASLSTAVPILVAFATLLLLIVSNRALVGAQECSSTNPTVCDQHERCGIWREEGECQLNKRYMKEVCPASCESEFRSGGATTATKFKAAATAAQVKKKTVQKKLKEVEPELICEDQHERCHIWARVGECSENKSTMRKYCPKSCGFCGAADGGGAAAVDDDDDDNYDADDDDEAVHFDSDDDDDDDDLDFLEGGDQPEDDPDCEDTQDLCTYWASTGECQANSAYMTYNCPVSCDTCDKVRERARLAAASTTTKLQGASTNTARATTILSDDDRQWLQRTEEFGIKQVAEGAQAVQTMQVIRESVRYMESDETRQLPKSILDVCENRHQFCAFWVTSGECDKNRAYMATNCAPSCKTCHLIDMEARCPKLVNPRPALGKGGLNRMFERIVREAPGNRTLTSDEQRQLVESNLTAYTVVVHSSPGLDSDTGEEVDFSVATDKSRPPWVITFEDFLTSEECDALVQLGHKYVYKRSEDVGERKFDGTHGSIQSDRRTSENAWCSDKDGCRQETVADNIHKRMSAVMNIHANHSEDLQLLKYEVGQYYRTHHDFIPHQVDRQCGPRILTFFLYLSDVEAGGGTNFPHLDLTVMPKKGRALLWPSILNSNPIQKDGRMMHQALEVEAGTKYAANGWIHLYDYVTPQANGCN